MLKYFSHGKRYSGTQREKRAHADRQTGRQTKLSL